MAITSHAFGRVTLTDEDAEKFASQVRYGRTSQSAKEGVKRGLAMSSAMKKDGKVSFSPSPKKRLRVKVG